MTLILIIGLLAFARGFICLLALLVIFLLSLVPGW